MGVSGLQIRPAVNADAEAMALLIGELDYKVTAPEVVERLERLSIASGTALVGEIKNEVIACLTISIMQVLHQPGPVGRISMFVVKDGLRGQGVGKLMLEEAAQVLAKGGCQLLEVTSNLRRSEAHSFYEHLGWQRTSLRFSKPAPKI